MDLFLNIRSKKGSEEQHYLIKPITFIGRTKENDIIINDNNVSKKHAKITFSHDLLEIHDLGSTNGVFINENRVTDKCLLKPGDHIRFGHTLARVVQTDKEIPFETHILHKLSRDTGHGLDQKKLRALYEITTELTGSQDINILGGKIFSSLRDIFNHDRAYIALFDRKGTFEPVCSDPSDIPAPLSKSIAKDIFRSGESLLLEDAIDDSSLGAEDSILSLRIRSAMCAPLTYNEQILGLIYLDKAVPGAYDRNALDYLRTIASMLAPLVENAKLWKELQLRYNNTLETLKETEANLLEVERTAAYVRLAHAMAHEIRNPVMVIGGLLRKSSKMKSKQISDESFNAILESILRVEDVLKEVDSFSRLPRPKKILTRIDALVRDEIENYGEQFQKKEISTEVMVNSSHLLIPVDATLIRKAVNMILRELSFCVPHRSTLHISIHDRGNNLEILFGERDTSKPMCNPYDPKIREKPFSLGLFLNIAHKILSDHGGSLLLDPSSTSACPVMMRIPRSKNAADSVRGSQ